MKKGTRIIVTHDKTCHNIKLGKVLEVIRTPTPYLVEVLHKGKKKCISSSELVEVEHHQELEEQLDEREFKRFWFWIKAIPFISAIVALCVISVAFLVIGELMMSDITASFACLGFALVVALFLRTKKEIHEQKIIEK